MRRVVFWVHLVLGVSLGVVIGVMSVTGLLLGFQRQLTSWIDGGPRVSAPPAAIRLPLDDVLTRASVTPAELDSVAIKADRSLPLTLTFHDRSRPALALDPFTAAIVDVPKPGQAQAFFTAVRRWHRWIGTNVGPWRASSAAITGAANLALLVLVVLGLYLWWPSVWSAAVLRTTAWFRPGLRGRARDFNWHHAVGVWVAIPLVLITASGLFMSYKWPALWLDKVAGTPEERAAAIMALNAPPPPPAAPKTPAAPAPVPPSRVKPGDASPGALFASIERLHPAWQTITLALPTPKEPHVQATVAEGNTYRPDQRWTILLDAVSASPASVTSYETMSLSRRIRSWYRYTHTGEAFGVIGQIVATAATAGAVVLVWTGLALAWSRLTRSVRRRSSAQPRTSRESVTTSI